jgi:hypothetical protein
MRLRFSELALVTLLAGCPAHQEVADFGVDEVAKRIVAAEDACRAAGEETLNSCAEGNSPGRVPAKVAAEVVSSYGLNCNAALGGNRCEAMLSEAYAEAGNHRAVAATASPR